VDSQHPLVDSQHPTGSHERCRGRLTPIVAHQRRARPADARGELTMHRHLQGSKPGRRLALHASLVAYAHLGVPIQVQDHDAVDPPTALDQALRQIDAPPLVGLGGGRGLRPAKVRLAFSRRFGWTKS
jgi:hypothetical protein